MTMIFIVIFPTAAGLLLFSGAFPHKAIVTGLVQTLEMIVIIILKSRHYVSDLYSAAHGWHPVCTGVFI